MTIKKIINFTIIAVLLGFAGCKDFSQTIDNQLFPRQKLNFYFLESEYSEGKYLSGDVHELGFKEYNNDEIRINRPIDDRMITLRSVFRIDSMYSTEDIYVVILPIDYPCRAFLNGVQLAIRGNYKNGYTNRLHSTVRILLPGQLLNYDENNDFAIQLYPMEGETYPVNEVFIANSRDASRYVFYRNLFGPKLLSALALCGSVFFFFYLIVYISRREYQKQHFLYFAFMNLFFVISYINNIFTYDFTNTFLVEKIARAGFPLFIFVGICFLLEYTNIFQKRKMIRAVLIAAYLPSLILVLTPGTTTEIIKAYNSYPLISLFVGNFILLAITLIYFLKERNLKSGSLFIIFLVNVIAGFHDGYYFAVLKTKPFILLTPNTVFGINLIIFFILAVDHSKLYHMALDSTRKLEKMNQELELLVEKRTLKTIEYANKLELANQTKDKFFSIIAHDLKNPFNILIGYSDVLKSDFREYGQDEIYQQLSVIYDTSVNGYNLLENLLKWSQSQTNKILFEPNKVNLYEITQRCIDELENQSRFKDIDVVNDIPDNFHIIADKNLLQTILRNLINNAVKFTHRNGMVSVGCRKEKEFFEIFIKDTGIGMSEEDLERIFRIDMVMSRLGTNREKGSGLGLILCKEFVEKHGGEIRVESEQDVGSVFTFTIPKIIQ